MPHAGMPSIASIRAAWPTARHPLLAQALCGAGNVCSSSCYCPADTMACDGGLCKVSAAKWPGQQHPPAHVDQKTPLGTSMMLRLPAIHQLSMENYVQFLKRAELLKCDHPIWLQPLCGVGNTCSPDCACPASGGYMCDGSGKCQKLCGAGNACSADCLCPTDTMSCQGGTCKVRGVWCCFRSGMGS